MLHNLWINCILQMGSDRVGNGSRKRTICMNNLATEVRLIAAAGCICSLDFYWALKETEKSESEQIATDG